MVTNSVPADSKTKPIATYKKSKSHVVPCRIGKIQTRHIVSRQGASRWVFSTDRRHQDHRHQDQRHLGHPKLAKLWIYPATDYLKTQALVDWIAKRLILNVIFVRSEEEDKKKYVCLFTGKVHQSPNSRCSDCSSCSDFSVFVLFAQNELFGMFAALTVRCLFNVLCSQSVRCSLFTISSVCLSCLGNPHCSVCSGCSSNF